MSLGMSTRDQLLTPRLAPVAIVDLTVLRATQGCKAFEGKGKGKAEEGHTEIQ
jgi:hypothetical protein